MACSKLTLGKMKRQGEMAFGSFFPSIYDFREKLMAQALFGRSAEANFEWCQCRDVHGGCGKKVFSQISRAYSLQELHRTIGGSIESKKYKPGREKKLFPYEKEIRKTVIDAL